MFVSDFDFTVAALDEFRDQVHRAGPVQRHERGDVLNRTDLKFPAQIAHPAGFQLEHAEGFRPVQQIVGFWSSSGKWSIVHLDACVRLTISQVLRMTVNVFSPRKSIFNRPSRRPDPSRIA